MSKKLIAVAAAAALALTGLVAAPAQASALTFSILDAGTTTTTAPNTALAPITHASPELNVLTFSATATTLRPTNTTVRFAVTGIDKQVVSVTAGGGVKVLTSLTDAAGTVLKPGAGVESLTATLATGNLTYTFYAYTTSTTPGTVTVSASGNTSVFHVASRAGTAYNVAATEFPTSVTADGTTNAFVYTNVTDVFGNVITDKRAADKTVISENRAFTLTSSRLALTAVGASVANSGTTWTWDTAKSKWKSSAITATAAQAGSLALRLDLSTEFYDIGLPRPVQTAFSSISAASLSAQVTALTAQVAALQAQLADSRPKARSVTKKRFNTLARKWNAANPGARVALKK